MVTWQCKRMGSTEKNGEHLYAQDAEKQLGPLSCQASGQSDIDCPEPQYKAVVADRYLAQHWYIRPNRYLACQRVSDGSTPSSLFKNRCHEIYSRPAGSCYLHWLYIRLMRDLFEVLIDFRKVMLDDFGVLLATHSDGKRERLWLPIETLPKYLGQ